MTTFEVQIGDHAVQTARLARITQMHGDSAQRRASFANPTAARDGHARAEKLTLQAPMRGQRVSTETAQQSVCRHDDVEEIDASADGLQDTAPDKRYRTRRRKLQCQHVRDHLDKDVHGVFEFNGKPLTEDETVALGREDVCSTNRPAAQWTARKTADPGAHRSHANLRITVTQTRRLR